jgi:phage baseplate assembly protein gpV
MLDRIKNFASNIIKQCYVTLVGDDSGRVPLTQVAYMDKAVECEVITPYGLYSNPPVNSMGILFHPFGDEQIRAAILNVLDERFKNLLAGEVQIGNPLTQCSIKFDKDGNLIIITSQDIRVTVGVDYSITVDNGYSLVATTDATIEAPTINLKGNVVIDGTLTANGGAITMNGGDFNTSGSITATGDVIGQGTSLHTHVHGGVTTGGSNTGAPV